MFTGVCLSTGGGSGPGGRGCLVPGGVPGSRGCAWSGVCVPGLGGVPGPGGGCLVPGMCAWSGGVCAWSGGVCAWSGGCVPGPGGACLRPPRTATAAGGTHPTGMHSCFKGKFFYLKVYGCEEKQRKQGLFLAFN